MSREGRGHQDHASWKAPKSDKPPKYYLDSHSGFAMSPEGFRARKEEKQKLDDVAIAVYFNIIGQGSEGDDRERYSLLSTADGVKNASTELIDFAIEKIKYYRKLYIAAVSRPSSFDSVDSSMKALSKRLAAASYSEKPQILDEVVKLASERASRLNAMIDYLLEKKN